MGKGVRRLNWDNLPKLLDKKLSEFEGKKLLITSRYIYINRILLGILDLLLTTRKEKGIYIAVDRPFKYTSRLLTKHNIPLDNLYCLDTVSMISSEKIERTENTEFLEGPFCANLMQDAIRNIINKEEVEGDMGFVFLDNVTVLLTYLDDDCLHEFLHQFVIKLSKEGKTITLVVVDKEAHPKTYERVVGKCDSELEISQETLAKMVENEDSTEKM